MKKPHTSKAKKKILRELELTKKQYKKALAEQSKVCRRLYYNFEADTKADLVKILIHPDPKLRLAAAAIYKVIELREKIEELRNKRNILYGR